MRHIDGRGHCEDGVTVHSHVCRGTQELVPFSFAFDWVPQVHEWLHYDGPWDPSGLWIVHLRWGHHNLLTPMNLDSCVSLGLLKLAYNGYLGQMIDLDERLEVAGSPNLSNLEPGKLNSLSSQHHAV